MIKKSYLIVILCFIFECCSVFAEDISPYGSDRFITEKIVLESEAIAGGRILLHSSSDLSGKLRIMADTVDSAIIEIQKIVKTSSRSKATEYSELTDVVFRKAASGLEVLFRTPNPAPWSGGDESVVIEGQLHLPKESQLKIEADYFDLDIEGPFVSVENDKSYGRLDVRDVTKIVKLTGSNRDITLKNIIGDITINLSHADVWIEEMKAEYQPARISNEYGNVNIEGLEGEFIITDSYGRIRMTDTHIIGGKSSIEGIQCPIHVSVESFEKAELFMSNSYEDIILDIPDTVAADFFLKTDGNGEIHLQGIPVKPLVIESNYVELSSGREGSVIKAGIEGGGNINIYGSSE